MIARQVLYHLSLTLTPFYFSDFFLIGSHVFTWASQQWGEKENDRSGKFNYDIFDIL
jgi:hypothetical protein